MDAQTHLKDLCGFLRRRSELSHVEREGVIPEYWTGAANHIEMMFAREVALRAEVESLTSLLKQMLDVAENCDETGYVDGVGFVNLDKLHDEVRTALKI